MKGRLTLTQPGRTPPLRLRSIGAADLEDLRAWKNANRDAFFFKEFITPAMQKKWFAGYLKRCDDCMFIVESGSLRAGCVAFRLEANGSADGYNIIASEQGRGKGLLKSGMLLLCSYVIAEWARSISVKVVSGNPAVGFYESCGFERVEERGGYLTMRLRADFKPQPYDKEGP